MKSSEAIPIIQAIAESLRNSPPSFSYQVNVTGMAVSSEGGGTGMQVTVHGATGQTVGVQVTAGAPDIELVPVAAGEALLSQIEDAASVLDELVTELQAGSPEPGKLRSLVDRLPDHAVGAVVGTAVRAVLGQLGIQL